ncbi:hypothetical protein KPSA3_03960 [Pseudomonas syringae pv. actinidiae]|uniref:Uncharacterized protein n=1 Tax=Pseudomonas syringae pv. actinidiae TaxID=103796 RepID=A0AAN4Q5X7_PSESF|nr:hypothetical protein KPSA3_03960 [Pseudomonas syringae pv. actinidiae]
MPALANSRMTFSTSSLSSGSSAKVGSTKKITSGSIARP